MQEERISPALIIIPVGLGLGLIAALGVAALARAAAGACLQLDPDRYYYFTYIGPSKTFKAALGECYPVIYRIHVWDEETTDWWPPADPDHDILETGSSCRVMVQEICTICGFEPVS